MSPIDFEASINIISFRAAGFTTNESGQVLLVSIHNSIYPITEYVLHQVFDPYGHIERIDILQSNELLQAIVQFDSCQKAIWAKSQLQGRYIYDRCCQLDIQFYRFFDNENQTGKVLMENEFAADLDFIRNKLNEMIVITERMQDRIKAMNSSSLSHIAAAASTIAFSPSDRTRSDVTPPTSTPTNVSSLTVSNPSSCPLSHAATYSLQSIHQTTLAHPIPTNNMTFFSKTKVVATIIANEALSDAGSTTATTPSPKSSSSHFISAAPTLLPTFHQTSHARYQLFTNSRSELVSFFQTMTIMKRLEIASESIHVSKLISGYNGLNGNYEHKLFGLMHERNEKKVFKRALFVFDPGGTFIVESISDLEDKVDFKGMVMIECVMHIDKYARKYT